MSRPQHPMLALGGAHEHQAHEGRLIELEATHAFAVLERLKPLLALGLRDGAPIEPLDGNLDSLDHLLHGLRDAFPAKTAAQNRSEEHTSELQSHLNLVCRLLLEKKK